MLRLLFLASLATTIQATEIKLRIGIPPNPMPGFSTNGYMGRWYIQFRKAPASCPGSTFYTDFEQNVMPEGKATLLGHMTWRSGGLCNSVTQRMFVNAPGFFKMVDNNGDTMSGLMIVVAMDYKNFVVHWGCTKMSASGKTCEDPWLSTGTRLPVPPKGVVAAIENILRSRFGVTIGELTKYLMQRHVCQNLQRHVHGFNNHRRHEYKKCMDHIKCIVKCCLFGFLFFGIK